MLILLAMTLSADAGRVDIASVTSKSDYNEGGVNYASSNLSDRKSQTAWFEGESGNGLGAWVEVDLGAATDVKRVVMLAGNWASSDEWDRANRPKELAVVWSDGKEQNWQLNDEFAPQILIPEGGSKSTTSIKFKIKQVYNGTAFPDTGITEVIVFSGDGPVPTTVTASTEFPRDSSGVYMPSLAVDSVRDTFWCENNKAGAGENEWIDVQLASSAKISGLEICSGMCAGMAVHKKGNVPTSATVLFSDGSTEKLTITPFPLPKKYPFSTPHTARSFKVTIDAVRAGSEYNDACFSELLPY